MALHELKFPSHNGRDQIHAWIWAPAATPRGIVQIVHGLAEHSRRYHHLITALLDAGFIVAADDHAGHGATAAESGVWLDTGENGADAVIVDERTLHDLVTDLYPGLPHIMFGHSWGTVIARSYAARHGSSLAALVLSGPASQLKGTERTLDRDALAAALADGDGTAPGPEFQAQLFDGFVDRFGPDAGPTDWVASDPGVIADHAADPLNNVTTPMSLRFMQDFVTLYDDITADAWAQSISTDLPVLILAGDQDPVCNYGEGALHIANRLWETGTTDVTTRLFPGARHEVHNEPDHRQDFEATVVDFLDRVAG
ncbi:alpha/beta fold hydrolase [Corynebacterium nuruki]|uniref:alpha/beta fold hydrolase n=1 Tax=Corynebacterium nuruki TaxID=1032851 RepID=UPI0039BEEB46